MKWYDYLAPPILIAGFVIGETFGMLLIAIGGSVAIFSLAIYIKEWILKKKSTT